MDQHGIVGIDIVVNNLYPFQETISKPDSTLDEALENIDIGGPAMTRAAAKNFSDVVIIVDPSDYESIGEMIARGDEISFKHRRQLAAKAFQHVAVYDTMISGYLRAEGGSTQSENDLFPEELTFAWKRVAVPRYGENPHQSSGIYANPGETGGVVKYRELHGIWLSYLNYFDSTGRSLKNKTFVRFAKELRGIQFPLGDIHVICGVKRKDAKIPLRTPGFSRLSKIRSIGLPKPVARQ